MTDRLTEYALMVDRALGKLQNAWWQSDDDTVPCDIRLHAALGLLLIARGYGRALRANGLDDQDAQLLIEDATEECSHQYTLRLTGD